MNECNEWKTEKCHECTYIAQLQVTLIIMATVAEVAKRAVFMNFMIAWFLLGRVYKRTNNAEQPCASIIRIHKALTVRNWHS
jgi:hypothetical protein